MKNKKLVTCIAVFVLIVLAYLKINSRYMQEKEYVFSEKIDFVTAVLNNEKEWITENQAETGEIYQNNTDGAKDVNPYFACQAAMGLLAGNITDKQLESVRDYLNWHTAELISAGGRITNYAWSEGKLNPTGKSDSVDGYIGVYLSLVGEYCSKGGDITDIENIGQALNICADELESLQTDGLTEASHEYSIRFLMDNVEVLDGCHRVSELLSTSKIKKIDGLGNLAARYNRIASVVEKGIKKILWNKKESRYEVGIDNSGEAIEFKGYDSFYPDAIAQIYPAAFGITFDKKNEKELYDKVCEMHDWTEMQLGTTFNWSVISYIAALSGDESAATKYLKTYSSKYSEERKYPLYTGDSGWVARTCGELIKNYEYLVNTSLLKDMFSWLTD